jgi:hypothetical protein
MRTDTALRAAAGATLILGAASTGVAFPGSHVLPLVGVLVAQQPPTPRPVTLSNPESFIRVHRAAEVLDERVRISTPESRAAAVAEARGLIAVPSSARAGDPSFDVPAEPEFTDAASYTDDSSFTTGMIFADGIPLGYSTLRRPGYPHARPRRDPGAPDAPAEEFGAHDLHRSAQLRFAEAAQPHLDGLDDAWRRAQLQFHRSTLTPGVPRGSDGLRHERSTPTRGRTRW